MALDVEWALSRSSVLLVNSLARSKSECLNFNALGHWSPSQIGSKIRLFLANVTKPAQALQGPIFHHTALSVTVSRGCYSLVFRWRFQPRTGVRIAPRKITLRRHYRFLAAAFRHRTPTAPDRTAAASLFFEARNPASSQRRAPPENKPMPSRQCQQSPRLRPRFRPRKPPTPSGRSRSDRPQGGKSTGRATVNGAGSPITRCRRRPRLRHQGPYESRRA
jgi:hypothetical protein